MYTKELVSHFVAMALITYLIGGIAMAAPIPSEVKSVVVFIFVASGDGKLIPNGTGFLVGVKNPSNPKFFSVYLVTAKHVLCRPNSPVFFEKVFVRLNKKGGGSQIDAIPLITDGEKQNVFTHNESSVDIAVIPFLPDQEQFDFKFLPDDMITTKTAYKELNIREGSDVFFTGLFTAYPGAERNYPVVRFGRVALVTNEKIEWQGKLMDLYLIEAGSYGGNSGSPVFFYLGSDREPGSIVVGSPILKLAGIMQGTFLDAHEIKIVETNKVPVAVSSMGIAAVVPAYRLHEVLFGDEMKNRRGF